MKRITFHDLEVAEIFVFQNYFINQIKPGVQVDLEHVQLLRDIIASNYPDRKMVYISNRIHTYTVDPLVYPEVSRIKNVIGTVMVTNDATNQVNAEFEQAFYQKDFGIFNTLDEAMIWASKLIVRKSSTSL